MVSGHTTPRKLVKIGHHLQARIALTVHGASVTARSAFGYGIAELVFRTRSRGLLQKLWMYDYSVD